MVSEDSAHRWPTALLRTRGGGKQQERGTRKQGESSHLTKVCTLRDCPQGPTSSLTPLPTVATQSVPARAQVPIRLSSQHPVISP